MTIKIWEIGSSYACVKTLNGHEHSVSSVQYINNNDYILSGSRDKSIKLWEVATGYCKKTFSGAHDEWVRDIVVSETLPNVFASCASDQTICIWNTEIPNPQQVLKGHDHVIETIIFIPLEAS